MAFTQDEFERVIEVWTNRAKHKITEPMLSEKAKQLNIDLGKTPWVNVQGYVRKNQIPQENSYVGRAMRFLLDHADFVMGTSKLSPAVCHPTASKRVTRAHFSAKTSDDDIEEATREFYEGLLSRWFARRTLQIVEQVIEAAEVAPAKARWDILRSIVEGINLVDLWDDAVKQAQHQ